MSVKIDDIEILKKQILTKGISELISGLTYDIEKMEYELKEAEPEDNHGMTHEEFYKMFKIMLNNKKQNLDILKMS